MRGESYASLKNALEVLLSRTSLDLRPRVSHHTSKHPIETLKLSPLLCSMRVHLTETGDISRVGSEGLLQGGHSVAGNVVLTGWIAVSVADNPVLSRAIEALNVVWKTR